MTAAESSIWHLPDEYDRRARRLQAANASLLALLAGRGVRYRSGFEFGCGTGLLTEELVRGGVCERLVACDPAPAMLRAARSKPALAGVELRQCGVLEFASPERFDGVFSNAALHWLYPRGAEALAHVASLLSPGGRLLLATAGRSRASDEFDALIEERLDRVGRARRQESFRERRLDGGGLEALLPGRCLDLVDAFVVERIVRLPLAHYAGWLLASGGPFELAEPEVEAVHEELVAALAGLPDPCPVGHWTLFAELVRRP